MTTNFQSLVRLPIQNSRTIANLPTYAQQYLDVTYTNKCYHENFILSAKPVLKPAQLMQLNATCMSTHDNNPNAYLDIVVQFNGYRLTNGTPLMNGRITIVPENKSAIVVSFQRLVNDWTIPVLSTIQAASLPVNTPLLVGGAINGIVTRCQYAPMSNAISCTIKPLYPQPGPSGNFNIDTNTGPAAKKLLIELRGLFAQHALKLKVDSYRSLCQHYARIAWLPRSSALTMTVDTTILDLLKDQPVAERLFYYDASDVDHLKLYAIGEPPTTKKIQLHVIALLTQIRENLSNMLMLGAP